MSPGGIGPLRVTRPRRAGSTCGGPGQAGAGGGRARRPGSRSRLAPFLADKLYWGSVVSSLSNAVSATPAPRSPADPVPQAPALWIETTAYGLLHLLLREGRAEMADQVAAWLTHQGSFQGGFRSTQVGAALGLWGGRPWNQTPESRCNVLRTR